jgi:hypothetical protein
MDKILELFEKSLAEYQSSIGKKDNLVGCGEIIAQEMRKQREQIVTLGRLLADFYAGQRPEPLDRLAGSPNVVPLRVKPT